MCDLGGKTLSDFKLIKIRVFKPSWEDDGHNELLEISVRKPVVMAIQQEENSHICLFVFHSSISTYIKFIYLFISFCKTYAIYSVFRSCGA